MKRKIILTVAVAVTLVAVSLTGILLANLAAPKGENILFTYPLSVEDKTYTVTVEANWDKDNPPTVTLTNSSGRHAIELYFLGGTNKTVTYNITFPTELLGGNVSLVWKYYRQNPDRYVLGGNGTHNSLQMTFDYDPHFSGMGYFEVVGTESAW